MDLDPQQDSWTWNSWTWTRSQDSGLLTPEDLDLELLNLDGVQTCPPELLPRSPGLLNLGHRVLDSGVRTQETQESRSGVQESQAKAQGQANPTCYPRSRIVEK